jgi:hypothetical protein
MGYLHTACMGSLSLPPQPRLPRLLLNQHQMETLPIQFSIFINTTFSYFIQYVTEFI